MIDALLSAVDVGPGSDDDILELSSLDVVLLVEEIESVHAVVLGATDVTRENFRTRAALRALLVSKGVSS